MVCFIYLLKVKCGLDYLFVLLVNCYSYNYHTKYLMMKTFFNETVTVYLFYSRYLPLSMLRIATGTW